MKVLAVASEAFPLVKTGGLADVVGALPAALAPHGVRVTTMLPGYPAVMAAVADASVVRDLPDLFGGPARLLAAAAASRALLVLDAPHLFARPGGPYAGPDGKDWPDNPIRFAALSAVAALAAVELGFDAVHAHDWQAGLVPAYLRYGGRPVPTLFTIHNLAFQGQYPASIFPALGLPQAAFATAGLEYFGMVGFLKAGLWFADRISTVSPTYAAEIRTPQDGMGLDGLLRGRAADLSGILNGLDTDEWNPATDAHLVARFTAEDPAPRALNKAALQQRIGLRADPAAPLFAFIGRLTWQKGIDLVLEALPALLAGGGQLAVLGTGDAVLEARCRGAASALSGRVGTLIAFDEALARLCYGGADVILMPSRFEPCGLGQLCALRYGAPPLVARVGGLADTVIDASPVALQAGVATGFQFAPVTAELLGATIQRAIGVFHEPPAWEAMQRNAMATELSWSRSAARYASLFTEMTGADD